MSEGDQQRAVDATMLMMQLAIRARVERKLDSLDDVVGVTVIPSTADAEGASLVLNSPRYNAARDELLEAGALERDHETEEQLANISGEPEAFKITRSGIQLLRNLGAR
jgi:hypothetical protein